MAHGSGSPIRLRAGPKQRRVHLGSALPDLCLVFDRTDRDGPDIAFDAPARDVEEANQLTLRGKWQQLFRHPDGPRSASSVPPLPDRLVKSASSGRVLELDRGAISVGA